VRQIATPDLKLPGDDVLLFVDLSGGHSRLGGSALAHCWSQLGDESPDVENPKLFAAAFDAIQVFNLYIFCCLFFSSKYN
jgi:phosphoribosylformylglycinamidine synthase